MANNETEQQTNTDSSSMKSQTNASGQETTLKDTREGEEQSGGESSENADAIMNQALEIKTEGQPLSSEREGRAAPAQESAQEPEVAPEVHELIEEKPEEVSALLRKEYQLPETWSDEQVTQWFEQVSNLPAGSELSRDGVFFNDPTRAGRSPSDWSTEELRLALKGELTDTTDSKLSAVIKEYRQRESLEAAWSFRQVLEYFRDAIIPAKTSTGVWVTDVTRTDRQPSDWSTAELESWAKGEISAAGKITDAKLALEMKKRLALPAKSNAPADVIAAYKATVNDAIAEPETAGVQNAAAPLPKGLTTLNQTYITSTMESYAKACAPGKPISADDGLRLETNLETMFQYVIKLQPEGMVAGLNQIRDWVKKNRDGLFSADNAHRFTNMMRPELKERHMNFVEALRIYVDPNTAVRGQADLRYLLAKQPEDRQEMLVEWFTKVA